MGIEQGIEAVHHRELAERATRQIGEEPRSNLREASADLAEDRKRIAAPKATEAAPATCEPALSATAENERELEDAFNTAVNPGATAAGDRH